MPLGPTEAKGHAAMINLIGGAPDSTLLIKEGVHLHLYNKSPREGRKIGHINLCENSDIELVSKMARVSAVVAPTQSG